MGMLFVYDALPIVVDANELYPFVSSVTTDPAKYVGSLERRAE
jgi:hypothetical protein